MIVVFNIEHGGVCPICHKGAHLLIHRLCIAEIAAWLEDGGGRLENWESPMPAQFQALRPYILKQLARTPVLIHAVPSLSE
jgi:hypothetical protein